MSRLRTSPLIAASALAAVLIGCSSTDGDDTPPDGAADAVEPGTAAEDAGLAGPTGRLVLTAWEERHPGGLVIGLRSVEVDEDGNIAVEFEATSIEAAVRLADTQTFLEDDLGNRYELVPTEGDDADLPLEPDQRALARLSFQGPVDPEATRVLLAFNAVNGEVREKDEGPPGSVVPGLAIHDIPLPGVGLDAEAVGTGPDRDSVTEATALDIDLTGSSDTGVTATATRVETDGSVVYVDVTVEVPTDLDRAVRINSAHPRLEDSTGATSLAENIQVANEDLATLDMEPGSTAEVRIAFRHPFAPDATHFDLRFNRRPSTEVLPEILIEDIPVPGRDDAAEAGDA